ncbi:hypothetical protein [Luteolibacter marinus]|uniref:hypothetical protein n=1 Tax=Luteolibacter marinus TaxID=2776705 RepID=UPI001865F56D|nr:hypothetical protein [Luteolibacter marinus]
MRRLAACLAMISPCLAESVADDVPIGIEVVTGYRTEYVHRGFKLASDLIDVQLEAEIALSDEWILNLGGFYGTGTGSGDFSEASTFFDLRYDTDHWTAGFATTWRDYQDSFFADGFDLSPSFTWHLTDDWDLGTAIAYDTGDGGWYGNLEASWSKPIGESSFLSVKGGSSWTEDYYGSSGWNDLYARIAWTYAFNKSVAVTPFAGTSIPMGSSPERNRLFAGLWFEVTF